MVVVVLSIERDGVDYEPGGHRSQLLNQPFLEWSIVGDNTPGEMVALPSFTGCSTCVFEGDVHRTSAGFSWL